MSIQPSTVYGVLPSAGCTVTKPPELSETMPTSLTIVTRAAASAASTALPPARATCSPASAAASLGAASATSGMGAGYPPPGRGVGAGGYTGCMHQPNDTVNDGPSTESPFRQPKAVWAVAFACVISFMGIGLVDPILPALAGQLDASPSQVELLFTSYLVVTAVMMLVTGWVSSRIGAKRTLITGLVIIVVFAALAGATGSIGGIIGFRAGWGLGNALFIATSLSVIVASASGGFAGAIVLYESALGVGIATGPLLGGVLGDISWRGPFFGVSVLMAISLVATLVLLPPTPRPTRKESITEPIKRAAAPQPGHHEHRRAALQLGLLHPARLLAVPHAPLGHPPRPGLLRLGRARRVLRRLRRPVAQGPLRHPAQPVRQLRPAGRSTSPSSASGRTAPRSSSWR